MARIVLINDEQDLLEMCKIVLESEGHSAEVAASPADAVELAAEADVARLDLVMPGTSGEEVLQNLRARRETATMQVVIMSALPDGLERAVDMGADGFLGKPFGPDSLLQVIEETLRDGARGDRRSPRSDGGPARRVRG